MTKALGPVSPAISTTVNPGPIRQTGGRGGILSKIPDEDDL